jgi:DNA-binding NarL/FixJ family response regulator
MNTITATPTVYIIDDHSLLRAGFRSSLGDAGFEVVGDCGDAREAVAEVGALRPNVVLLDITMPGLSGIDAISMLRKASPRTKIIMVTHHEGTRFVEKSLRAGAEGYLSKSSDPGEMTLAIQAVMRGDSFVSPKVSSSLMSKLRGEAPATDEEANGLIDVLTPREREVFQLLALGHCNKEVARDLGMSVGTAKKHRENLQRKLDCHSAAELARLAIREGLLES